MLIAAFSCLVGLNSKKYAMWSQEREREREIDLLSEFFSLLCARLLDV